VATTAAGLPEGLPTFATIGAAGGSLASSDGRLTVVIPPGTFASGTEVGIQPITATAPGALGSGYRLTPEGVTFAQPVTLRFGYPADEAAANATDLMRVATRDSRGHWIVQPVTPDAGARTLSVTTTHFSDWSYVGGLQLVPASATLEVNRSMTLRTIDCGDWPDPNGTNAQRVLLECRTAAIRDWPTSWAVNGSGGGNATDGTINTIDNLLVVARYDAPGAPPAQNPVAVSASLDGPAGRMTLVSNITVTDKVPGYVGTIFGRVDTEIQGQRQFVELSANLRFTYNPALSIGGTKWFDGTGTGHVRGRPFGCSGEGSGTAPILGQATLQLQTEGPHAGTYSISAGALATVTVTCGDPPAPVTIQMLGAAGAGGSDICPFPQIGTDPARLVGTWSCYVAEGSTQRANWTLRAL
jgi:hypothetical protein